MIPPSTLFKSVWHTNFEADDTERRAAIDGPTSRLAGLLLGLSAGHLLTAPPENVGAALETLRRLLISR